MNLGQLVFVSATVENADKICLAGRSDEIDDRLTEQIVLWIPQRWELAQRHTESISFFQIDDERFALARSVRGILDLRGHGEKQLVTSVMVVSREQIEAYSNNAAMMASIVLTHGGMHLPIRFQRSMPQFEIPDHTVMQPVVEDLSKRNKELDSISRAIEIHHQVAIVGLRDPLDYVSGHLSLLGTEARLATSFAIGLDVAPHRPFQLQFFRGTDSAVQKELARQQVRTISLSA